MGNLISSLKSRNIMQHPRHVQDTLKGGTQRGLEGWKHSCLGHGTRAKVCGPLSMNRFEGHWKPEKTQEEAASLPRYNGCIEERRLTSVMDRTVVGEICREYYSNLFVPMFQNLRFTPSESKLLQCCSAKYEIQPSK